MNMATDKTVIITGGNTGLGYHIARSIAIEDKTWKILLACRNADKADRACKKLISETRNEHIDWMLLDLSAMKSVRNFCHEFRVKSLPPLKGIICNAGTAVGDKMQFTSEGIELTFATNHLGHFLLIHLLSPLLLPGTRIVFVSSELHRNDGPMKTFLPEYTHASDLAFPEKKDKPVPHSGSHRYATTKLCNVLSAYEFADRFIKNGYLGISVNAMNPGLMPDTGLGDLNKKIFLRFFLKFILPLFIKGASTTPGKSGEDLAHLLIAPELEGVTGKYFNGINMVSSSDESYDKVKALDLWNVSYELAGLKPGDSVLPL
jgi:NAD(P)-dependent dehydrogenase (short-subunit alcohol dehydrogenase family)